MSYRKAAPRIPDDDPVNVALLGMGFKRAKPTPAQKKPVNKWYKGSSKAGRELVIKPNYKAEYVAVVRSPASHPGQFIYERVPGMVYDDPLTLAAALVLEGDGDAVLGAYRIKYGRNVV